MKKRKLFCLLILFAFCLTFVGCDISLPKQDYAVSGNVYINSNDGLGNVKIKTKSKIITETDNNGYFNFNEVSSHSFEIFPEKEGYTFLPQSIEITQSTDKLVFTAQKIKDLNGDLCLSHIIITPTSIASSQYYNYSFINNNNSCLKIKNLKIEFNNEDKSLTNLNIFATKKESNIIDFKQDITIKTGESFQIKFCLDVYYKFNQEECLFTEQTQSILNVIKTQTTQDLDSNNQISYNCIGINSSDTKFSYNITFVFDYRPNI